MLRGMAKNIIAALTSLAALLSMPASAKTHLDEDFTEAHFGQINFDKIRILPPRESSQKVRKEFENELATKRDRERRQAEWDEGTYFHRRMMY